MKRFIVYGWDAVQNKEVVRIHEENVVWVDITPRGNFWVWYDRHAPIISALIKPPPDFTKWEIRKG